MTRFNVGDNVVIPSELDSILLQKYGLRPGVVYTVSAFMNSERDYLLLDGFKPYLHHSYFDFYKEEKEMTQQAQQKTKRVPFTHELWEKYKDVAKIIYIPSGGEVLGFACFPQAGSRFRYAYLTLKGTAPTFGSGESLYLEIPVTTKRIPFNPELKDAKVFIKADNTFVEEWHLFSNGLAGIVAGNTRYLTAISPIELEMEIEEDV